MSPAAFGSLDCDQWRRAWLPQCVIGGSGLGVLFLAGRFLLHMSVDGQPLPPEGPNISRRLSVTRKISRLSPEEKGSEYRVQGERRAQTCTEWPRCVYNVDIPMRSHMCTRAHTRLVLMYQGLKCLPLGGSTCFGFCFLCFSGCFRFSTISLRYY